MKLKLPLILGFFILFAIIIYFAISKPTENLKSETSEIENQNTDTNQKEIQYKNGTVKIPILTEMEIINKNVKDILCIGRKTNHEHVRCIRVGDKIMYPSYGSDFTWKISDCGKNIIISSKLLTVPVKIPIEKAVYTGYQCWGSNGNGVSDQSFAYHLSEYMQFV